MITVPPAIIDGARVLEYAPIGPGQTSTGATRHSAPDVPEAVAAVVLAQYEDDDQVYVFYCDLKWAVLSDISHSNIADARAQAEFEFTGLEFVVV